MVKVSLAESLHVSNGRGIGGKDLYTRDLAELEEDFLGGEEASLIVA